MRPYLSRASVAPGVGTEGSGSPRMRVSNFFSHRLLMFLGGPAWIRIADCVTFHSTNRIGSSTSLTHRTAHASAEHGVPRFLVSSARSEGYVLPSHRRPAGGSSPAVRASSASSNRRISSGCSAEYFANTAQHLVVSRDSFPTRDSQTFSFMLAPRAGSSCPPDRTLASA
jgi:hypothetical protein